MYHSHFGFNVKPFQINADPAFLWLGEQHTEALSFLRYGVLENRGFLLLTGDVGTGKTTLLNALLQNLDDSNVLVARIPDPRLDLIDFINILADRLGMNESFASRGPFLISFEKFLNRQHYMGRNVLLIIDEAQRLTYELLEEVRALSNLEKPNAKLFNVFFVGQGEFNDMLLDHRSRALRQRITLSYHLEPLNRKEIGEYIRHRQKVAGGKKDLFSAKAVDRIYEFSAGFPRLINIICDHALLSAYAADKKNISEQIVSECARDLELRAFIRPAARTAEHAPRPAAQSQPAPVRAARPSRRKKAALAAFFIPLFFLVCGYLFYQWIPESKGSFDSVAEKEKTAGQTQQLAETRKSVPESTFKPVSDNTPAAPSAANTQETKSEPAPPEQRRQPDNRQDVDAAQNGALPGPSGDTGGGQDVLSEPGAEQTGETNAALYADKTFAVNFPNGAYALDSDSVETLDRVKRLLRQHPGLRAEITGYTDSFGDDQYNIHLSRIRANIVKSYLIGNGVDSGKIDSRGLGSQNPAASNETEQGRAKNRRVEIVFDYSPP
ncbi:MAG: OmpA family protein [Desulfobacteraceae bacterium]|nr:OmpA family protein [Desulfobacteraceae bacterium]